MRGGNRVFDSQHRAMSPNKSGHLRAYTFFPSISRDPRTPWQAAWGKTRRPRPRISANRQNRPARVSFRCYLRLCDFAIQHLSDCIFQTGNCRRGQTSMVMRVYTLARRESDWEKQQRCPRWECAIRREQSIMKDSFFPPRNDRMESLRGADRKARSRLNENSECEYDGLRLPARELSVAWYSEMV